MENKVVIITGASRGIGKAAALLFAKEKCSVVVNYKSSKDEAEATCREIESAGGKAVAIQADVATESDAERLVNESITAFGKIDILVNNAGGYIEGDEWNGHPDIWSKTFQKNVISVMNMSKLVSEKFIESKSGVIVNIASRFGLRSTPDHVAYSAAKAAVINVTLAYSKLLAPYGRANTISPGATNAGGWLEADDDELKELAESIPLKRLNDPSDIAEAIVFLASDKARFITGQNLVIDGGFTTK